MSDKLPNSRIAIKERRFGYHTDQAEPRLSLPHLIKDASEQEKRGKELNYINMHNKT